MDLRTPEAKALCRCFRGTAGRFSETVHICVSVLRGGFEKLAELYRRELLFSYAAGHPQVLGLLSCSVLIRSTALCTRTLSCNDDESIFEHHFQHTKA